MTISILTLLVTVETFIILLAVTFFLARKHSKLKKAFDKLMASLSENVFPKLVEEEIDRTTERAKEIIKQEADELDLAETNDINDDDSELSEEEQELKRALTFRSAYLHAELNAFNTSEGDAGMFWFYLAENIAPLMPSAIQETEEEALPTRNEFIDEIMQELQDKLDKATESNLTMQALLDSLLANGQLEAEQIHTIKNSQADFHDLSAHVSDLEQKIQNSLNIEITGSQPKPKSTVTEKTLVIDKTSNKVNTETNKLKDIIFDQGNKINQLLKQVKSGAIGQQHDTELLEQLETLARSQQETTMCMEVLEMENNRLQVELNELQEKYSAEGNAEMTDKVAELENIINLKDQELEQLNKEFNSIQTEYMAVYDKGGNQT